MITYSTSYNANSIDLLDAANYGNYGSGATQIAATSYQYNQG